MSYLLVLIVRTMKRLVVNECQSGFRAHSVTIAKNCSSGGNVTILTKNIANSYVINKKILTWRRSLWADDLYFFTKISHTCVDQTKKNLYSKVSRNVSKNSFLKLRPITPFTPMMVWSNIAPHNDAPWDQVSWCMVQVFSSFGFLKIFYPLVSKL